MSIEAHDGLELWKPTVFNPWGRMVEGHYYGMTGSNAYNCGANYLIGQYLYLPVGGTYDRLGISVQTAGNAGAKARLGIYDCGDALYPGGLILDAGEVEVTTTGVKEISINQHLPGGIYFLALTTNDTAVKFWMLSIPMAVSPLGLGTTINYSRCGWKVSRTYGVLPSVFSAGAAAMNEQWSLALRLQTLD
ncbi:MAG: hypothetical protein JW846_08290 [Dehalococcoidia bacterium]|nr:hypothetical protein [Dehalococcoidia bacterium]